MVVLGTAANLTTTWLLSTVLNNSVVRLLRASGCLHLPDKSEIHILAGGFKGTAKGGTKRERIERKYKNAGGREPRNSDDGGVTAARAKRFLTIGIYGVRVDYSVLEGSGNGVAAA